MSATTLLSEADTRAKLIDPALHDKGWTEDVIGREETAGVVEVVAGQPRKGKGRVDYVLRLPGVRVPVALIEAKPARRDPGAGLQQAKDYAAAGKRHHVPFVYSSNGLMFVQYDALTGETQGPLPMSLFPGPEELRVRYEQAKGFSLDSLSARPLLQPYHGGESQRRYYQDAAIRAVLEKTAAGGNRALLAMATGSGKTRVAVLLLKKIADAGQLRRALFVCDRDELRSQALGALQNAFGADAAAAFANNPEKNARIVVATYQTLGVADDADDATFLTRHYPEDYFSHVIIDEAHRSAWNKWSQVLTRNPNAVQIGLTATPREFEYAEDDDEAKRDREITADNIRYFGEPIYEYSIGQGIEDGYLAAMEIHKHDVFLESYAESEKVTGIAQEDLEDKILSDARTGEAVSVEEARGHYGATSFEERLRMPDRVQAMCEDLFRRLLANGGGPHQKTIVFCASDAHADDVANTMNNLYADWTRNSGGPPVRNYAFKCTAAAYDNHLPDFKDNQAQYFIATTVDLLSTGVDAPAVRNVVFFRYVASPIAFYQMVGRGTRLHPATNKLMFRLYDYTNASRLFGQEFKQKFAARPVDGEPDDPADAPPPRDPEPSIRVLGLEVRVEGAGVYVLTTDEHGVERPMAIEDYTQRLAAKLVENIPALDDFRETWVDPPRRRALLDAMPDDGRAPYVVRQFTLDEEYDLYDVLAHAAYGQAPKKRLDRAAAFEHKNHDWLNAMPPQAARAVRAIASQFAKGGAENLERTELFDTPEVRDAGGLAALRQYAEPSQAVAETKRRLFLA